MQAPSVLKFTDFRKYLLKFKVYLKHRERFFGYREFSAMLGFSSASELHNVIESGYNLTLDKMVHIIRVLRMPAMEAEYFELLVHLGTAKGAEARRYYLKRVLRFRKRR